MSLQKSLSLFLIYGFCCAAVYTKTAFAQGWQPVPHVPIQGSAEFLVAHPQNPDLLFIGTGGNLYASFDQGKNWKQLIGLGANAKVNRLYFETGRIFLLSSEGLFESQDQGKNWKKIFGGAGSEESNVLSLSQNPHGLDSFYLGTSGGLFASHDNGKTWRKEANELARQFIYALKTDSENEELFIAAEKGLYRILPNRFEQVYETRSRTNLEQSKAEIEAGVDSDLETETGKDQIQTIAMADSPSSTLAIGTQKGVWVSEDEGNHWERLPLSGFQSLNILDLVYSPKQKTFFAATEKGVYVYDRPGKHWRALQEGLPLARINQLALIAGPYETLYAVGENGAYQIIFGPETNNPEINLPLSEAKRQLFAHLIRSEPAITTIQKQAIRYANVSHWKTKRWQWASRFRALIPSFSVGKDFSRGDSIDLDRGGTSDADRYIVGPPDKSQSWSYDLNWDLADLLWNSSQTSVDSREKLMVELRDDILSEITRLYFERRRAQAEFVLRPPADLLEQTHSLLRIDELTASIDALTDSYLSRELQKLYTIHPEFQKLWETTIETYAP